MMKLLTVHLALAVGCEAEAYDAANEILREQQRSFVPGSCLLDYAVGPYHATAVKTLGYDEGDMLDALNTILEGEPPTEWLAVVTDEDGDRIDSETFGGDYSIEHIRETAMNHFGDLPAGNNLRFYPIAPERVDLAIGFAGDIRGAIRYAVDGKEFDDDDSPLAGDGQFGPFIIFDIDAQDYLPGTYATREDGQKVADLLNERGRA